QYGPVQGADHRYFDVEDVRENLATLTQDLVVALRAEEIEALGADCVHKGVTATGQDHHAVGLVLADHVEEMDELLMRMAVEDQLAAVSVKGDFEYAIWLTLEAGVRERVAIGIEFDHWGLLSTAVSRCLTTVLPTSRSLTAQRTKPHASRVTIEHRSLPGARGRSRPCRPAPDGRCSRD